MFTTEGQDLLRRALPAHQAPPRPPTRLKLAAIDLARKLTDETSFESAAIARPARALLPR
jgi:hypothetical protein